MNQFLPERFDERIARLALGLELLDAARQTRVSRTLDVAIDGVPWPKPLHVLAARGGPKDVLERIPRHESCLHAVLERPGLKNPLPVRIADASRRLVPRRLSFALTPWPARASVSLYPGAAYDCAASVTGLRGRVCRPGAERPVRWTRVVARLVAQTPQTGALVGRAFGDDRGEFLLLIDAAASGIGDLVDPLQIEVSVYGRTTDPTPDSAELPALDPIWDVPQENASVPGVLDGTSLPAGFVSAPTSVRVVPFPLGRLVSAPKFEL